MMLLLLLLYHLCSTYVYSSNDAQCEITDITDRDWQGQLEIEIGDNKINQPIFTSKYNGTIDTITCSNMKDFFAVERNDSDFIIKTTKQMESFDERTNKISAKFTTEIFKCSITCNSSKNLSTLAVFLKITDINTHHPKFYQNDYTYLVPSPLMSLTDFSIYGTEIIVNDLDFSNQQVKFIIDPDDFDIKTITSAKSKNYTAKFLTRKPIKITEDKVYKLTATDSGDNPHQLSSITKITLKSNPSSSIDYPSFTENSYEYNYSDVDGPKLTPRGAGDISVKTNKVKDLSERSFTLVGDLSEYLTPVYNSSSQTVTFTTKKISKESGFLLSTLSVKTDNNGTTAIVVYMPDIKFNSHIYNATYNKKDKTFTVEPVIQVQSPSGTPLVNITGEYIDYFKIDYNSSTKIYDFSLSEDHSIEKLGNIYFTKLLLTATLGEHFDKAELLITLPKHDLKFTKPLYIGSYDPVGKNVHFDRDNLIKFTTGVDDVDIILDKANTSYFSVKYNSTENTCDFKVITDLPTNILEAGKDIIITITAEDKYTNKDQSNVKIVIPSTESLLEFSDAFYEIYYPSSGSGTIDLPLKFKTPKDQSKVLVTPTSYTDNFKIQYTSNKWQLHIKKALNSTIIKTRRQIPIAILATFDGYKKHSLATLLVNLPSQISESFRFSRYYYTGIYTDNGTEKIELGQTLSFIDNTNSNDINIFVESYEDYFEIIFDADKWRINIKRQLDEVLKNNPLLITNLVATRSTYKAKAVLIIQSLENQYPKDTDAPKFSAPYYIAKLHVWNHQLSAEFKTPINITNKKDMTKIDITVESTYEKYLKVFYVPKQHTWNVSGMNDLPQEMKDDRVIVTTLNASEHGRTSIGQTFLILAIFDETPVIQFKNSVYDVVYPDTEEGEMTINPNIQLENIDNINDVSIYVNELQNNFEVLYESTKNWYINIKKPLNEDILRNFTDVIAVMTATEEGKENGTAPLHIKLPRVVAPIFSSAVYYGNYTDEDGTGTVSSEEIRIINKDDLSKISVTVESAYRKYFNFTYDRYHKSWLIHLLESLPGERLTEQQIIIELTATDTDNTLTAKSVLILKLPWDNGYGLKFSKSYYFGKYMVKDKHPSIDIEQISITSNDLNGTRLSVDSGFEKYFEFSHNPSKKSWTLEARNILPDNILSTKELILSVTASEIFNLDQANATVILSLPSNETTQFSSLYYEVAYDISHGKPEIVMNDKIEIISTESVDVYLKSDAIDAKQYFSIEKLISDQYVMHVIKSLPDEIVQRPSLVLTLVAKMSYAESTSTLVVNMPAKMKEEAIKFEKVLYTGKLEDGKLSVGKIDIVTNEADARVWTRIEESKYSKYFEVSYRNKELTVSVNKSAPEEGLKAFKSTLFTIAAGIRETSDQTSAVLNIRSNVPDIIQNSTDGNRGAYIATISVLAIALVIFIVGSAVFYKIKMRKHASSNNFEDVGHVRFDKKSQGRPSSSNERKSSDVSQRRPTGFIFNPLDEEIVEEISNPNNTERRKSVAFDENVQELHIESPAEEGDKSDVDSEKGEVKQTQEEILGSGNKLV